MRNNKQARWKLHVFSLPEFRKKVQTRVAWALIATYDYTATSCCTSWRGHTTHVVAVSCRGVPAATHALYIQDYP